MGFEERLVDSFNAWAYKNAMFSVHTKDEVGVVVGTKILRGVITIKSNSGEIKTYRGREVADLDIVL